MTGRLTKCIENFIVGMVICWRVVVRKILRIYTGIEFFKLFKNLVGF